MSKIKVIVVDDSALVRESFKELLSNNSQIDLIGVFSNPLPALQFLDNNQVDVIITDIEMPNMDGLTFIKKVKEKKNIPFIVCSSYIDKFTENYFSALKLGAVEIIAKPKIANKSFYEESSTIIIDAIKAASIAKTKKFSFNIEIAPKLSADVMIEKPSTTKIITTDKIIVIGSSTGGTDALEYIFSNLKPNVPGIVVTQHMPEQFTNSFAKRLNNLSKLEIKEAATDDIVKRSHVYIAKGNQHLLVKRNNTTYFLEVKDGPLVSRHRPSVDVLFRSAARAAAQNCIGILLTGMGDDGAQGLLELKNCGAFTIAQDENSCVVFGMPREAIRLGAHCKIYNLDEIIHFINNLA